MWMDSATSLTAVTCICWPRLTRIFAPVGLTVPPAMVIANVPLAPMAGVEDPAGEVGVGTPGANAGFSRSGPQPAAAERLSTTTTTAKPRRGIMWNLMSSAVSYGGRQDAAGFGWILEAAEASDLQPDAAPLISRPPPPGAR